MKAALFYLSLSFVIAHNMFRNIVIFDVSEKNALYFISIILMGILCAANFWNTKLHHKILILVISLFLLFFTLASKDLFLITIWLAILAFKGLNFEKAVRFDLLIKVICLILVACMSRLGMANTNLFYDGEKAIYCFGFENPNIFCAYVMSIVLDILYIRRKNLGLFDLAATILVSLPMLFLLGSRTQPIVMIMAVVLLLASKAHKLNIKKSIINLVKHICNHSFTIMAILSLLATFTYIANPSSEYLKQIDDSLSGRIRISAHLVDTYGINAIGNKTYTNDTEDFTSDNQFVYIAVMYGFIPLVVTCFVMSKYMKMLSKEKRTELYIIMLMFIISGLVEKSCLRIQYNVFMLYSSALLFGQDRNNSAQNLPCSDDTKTIESSHHE